MTTKRERFVAPFLPYDPTDPNGFSYETVLKRWPIIITNLIDTINNQNHRLHMNPVSDSDERIAEGNAIISKASKLKYEMARDKVMYPLEDDGGAGVEVFNDELTRLAERELNTWFKAPWLFAECYLYRLIRQWFLKTIHWSSYDPFFSQKESSFKSSGAAVYQLAQTMQKLDSEHQLLAHDDTKLEVLWDEMIQMCLWGNATDLSLLTNLTHEDIQSLQTVNPESRAKRREFILKDDSHAAWEYLKSHPGRVDIVLDNAGFELYTDLLFADFLVTHTNLVSSVTFHPKTIPWFVSDVLPADITALLAALSNGSSYFPSSCSSIEAQEQEQALSALVTRWSSYFESGIFKLSVPFNRSSAPSEMTPNLDKAAYWTLPHPYWDMDLDDPVLLKDLHGSSLVIFKGDLNYRKLTGDVAWPPSTPFTTALGPLNGQFPILSLRTNKADVVVGLTDELAEEVEKKDAKWRVNGKYALISFATSFSS